MWTLPPLLLLLLLLLLSPLSLSSPTSFSKTTTKTTNPFSAKAALIRYWNRKVPNHSPHPSFLLSKLSPLSPLSLSSFSSLPLSSLPLPSFCSSAHLLCSSSPLSPSLSSSTPSSFTVYQNSNFSNYVSDRPGLSDSFSNYSDSLNVPIDTFRRYSRGGVGDSDSFSLYSLNGNVVTTNFTSYSSAAVGGSGTFTAYQENSNVPDLLFSNYDKEANGPVRTFSHYTDNVNAGDEAFRSYARSSNGVTTAFTSYANNSNVVGSGFATYGKDGNGAGQTFASYGENGNVPENTFNSYGDGGTGGVDTFSNYRNQSNVGDDFFTTYGKGANEETAEFNNYGLSFNPGSDNFKKYGEGSFDDNMTFTSYAADNTSFKGYANFKPNENEFTFKTYKNSSVVPHSTSEQLTEEKANFKKPSGKIVNKWLVEPGKFFRERNLRKGTVMPMPDIRDKMPARSFLPRSIASRIPFSAGEVRDLFAMPADTAMGKAVGATVADCDRAPSRGETKRCATSAEDMIDFAVEVLGSDVVVRSTENTKGSGGSVLIGEVKGVNGGKVTKSVSCHQSLFPYLVYYCHSVPKVRVYEAEILAVDSKERINRGVAICHLDTSDWSAGHGAFVALGSKPGQIEVCHWIFEGDMTWAVAD